VVSPLSEGSRGTDPEVVMTAPSSVELQLYRAATLLEPVATRWSSWEGSCEDCW
jgi:hypothetical protein